MLPVAASLAIVLSIFALVSVPGWFERDKPGFTDPALSADVVGLLTALAPEALDHIIDNPQESEAA